MSLRDKVANGTAGFDQLTNHVGEILIFPMKGAEKVTLETQYGIQDVWRINVMALSDESPSGFFYIGGEEGLVIFASVISKELDTLALAIASDDATEPYLIGRLVKPGQAYLLEAIEESSDWDKIEAAVKTAETSFDEET